MMCSMSYTHAVSIIMVSNSYISKLYMMVIHVVASIVAGSSQYSLPTI